MSVEKRPHLLCFFQGWISYIASSRLQTSSKKIGVRAQENVGSAWIKPKISLPALWFAPLVSTFYVNDRGEGAPFACGLWREVPGYVEVMYLTPTSQIEREFQNSTPILMPCTFGWTIGLEGMCIKS